MLLEGGGYSFFIIFFSWAMKSSWNKTIESKTLVYPLTKKSKSVYYYPRFTTKDVGKEPMILTKQMLLFKVSENSIKWLLTQIKEDEKDKIQMNEPNTEKVLAKMKQLVKLCSTYPALAEKAKEIDECSSWRAPEIRMDSYHDLLDFMNSKSDIFSQSDQDKITELVEDPWSYMLRDQIKAEFPFSASGHKVSLKKSRQINSWGFRIVQEIQKVLSTTYDGIYLEYEEERDEIQLFNPHYF